MSLHLLAALFSGLFFALGGVIYKIGNKHLVRNPLTYLLYYNLFRVFIVGLSLPWFGLTWPKDLSLGFFYALSFFLGTLLTGLALVDLDVSVFMPLFNLQIIFTPLFAFFFLGERLSPISYLLMLIIFLGGFLVTYSQESQRRRFFLSWLLTKILRRQISLPFLAGKSRGRRRELVLAVFVGGLIFYSLSDNLAGLALRKETTVNLVFWSGLSQLLFSLFLIPLIKNREAFDLKEIWPIPLGVWVSFLGLFFIVYGFAYNVSLSQALSRLSSVYSLIIVVWLARFRGEFLEKHANHVYAIRFLGSGIMVLAAAALLFLK